MGSSLYDEVIVNGGQIQHNLCKTCANASHHIPKNEMLARLRAYEGLAESTKQQIEEWFQEGATSLDGFNLSLPEGAADALLDIIRNDKT